MSSYELNVETRDMGTPQMTCSATVIVTIIDANDNSPSVVNCLDVQFANEVSMLPLCPVFMITDSLELCFWF